MSGTGNIKVDPLFVDAMMGDLHLKVGSPCIGTGTVITGATAGVNPNAPGQVAQGGATPAPPAPQNDPNTANVKIDLPTVLKDPVGTLRGLFGKPKKPAPKPTAPKPAPGTNPQPNGQPATPATLAPDVDPLFVDLNGKPRPKTPSMGAYEGQTK